MVRAYTKEDVLRAIEGSYGNMSQISRKLGCAWHTADKFVRRWKETRLAYEGENERALDFSEAQMLARIKAGDGPMIRFHLMTKGRHRGYITRQEVAGAEDAPIRIEYVIPHENRADSGTG